MKDISFLKEKAKEIRKSIVSMIAEAKSGHPGGSLSATDILTALYFSEMNVDPTNPKMKGRDRFVLSKGHAAPAIYATLAEKGYFSKDELMTLRKFGSRLQGHPDMKKLPGIEISTGSLGQGLSVADKEPPGCPDFASAIIETIDFLISLAFSFKKLISFIVFSSHFLTLLIKN